MKEVGCAGEIENPEEETRSGWKAQRFFEAYGGNNKRASPTSAGMMRPLAFLSGSGKGAIHLLAFLQGRWVEE